MRAPLPAGALDDAPWERSYAPDELTEELRDIVWAPSVGEDDEVRYEPAAGVRIELLLPRPDGHGPVVPGGETLSAADGSFRLSGVPRGPYALRTSRAGRASLVAGHSTRIRHFMILDFSHDRALGSQPGRELGVRVVDRDGRPVAGAEVEASSFAFVDTVTTGADGTARMFVPAGTVGLVVLDPRWEPVRVLASKDDAVAELRTAATPPLAGTVVTAEDGRPVEGATVFWGEDRSRSAVSDGAGRFTLPVPRFGRIFAAADGRAWRAFEIPVAGDVEVRLRAGQTVRGVVRDVHGAPVADARILVVATDPPYGTERATGPRTAADGSFTMTWAPRPAPSGRAHVVAWHRRLGLSQAVKLPATGPVELRLSGFTDVAGRALEAGGRPLARASVSVSWRLEGLDGGEAGILEVPTEQRTDTAADGSFVLRGVPTDRAVTLTATSYGVSIERELAAAAPRTGVDFEFQRSGRISGRVTNAKGEAPGAEGGVVARLINVPGTTFERFVATGPDGVFDLDAIPPGTYVLEARVKGYDLRASRNASPGDLDVRIPVERSAPVFVRLVPAEAGGALPSVPVTVWLDDVENLANPVAKVEIAPGGTEPVRVGAFSPGSRRVRVEGGAWRGLVEKVTLVDGETLTVDVPMRLTLKFTGKLVDADGSPLVGERIFFHAVDVPSGGATPPPVVTTSGAGGVVETTGLLPGRWSARVSPRNRAALELPITFPTEAEVELRLPASGELVVRVRGADGSATAGAIVSIEGVAGEAVWGWNDDTVQRVPSARTDADGVARLRGVPAGRIRVGAKVGAARLPSKEVTIEARKTAEVSLE